jgi:hypothetical protein
MPSRVISFAPRIKTPSPKPVYTDPLQLTFLIGRRTYTLQVAPPSVESNRKTAGVIVISKTKR